LEAISTMGENGKDVATGHLLIVVSSLLHTMIEESSFSQMKPDEAKTLQHVLSEFIRVMVEDSVRYAHAKQRRDQAEMN